MAWSLGARIGGAWQVAVAAAMVSCASPQGSAAEAASVAVDGQPGKAGSAPEGDAGAAEEAGDAAEVPPEASRGGRDAGTPDAGLEASSDAGSSGPPDASAFDGEWSRVSFGVTRLDPGGGDNIVIAYGGYTATQHDSEDWVRQLTLVRLWQLGVGHMVAVRGPNTPDYSNREIGNSELAALLATLATPSTHVIVIAHSSGGFVADELFTFADPAVMAKIAYFNLDGGSWSLNDARVASMQGVYFCGAHDPAAGYSENWSSDQSLHADFPASHLFLSDSAGSGCDVGAGWCLHDTLIISRPHDPATYDLALDYTDFTDGRHVVTTYIDQGVSDGVL